MIIQKDLQGNILAEYKSKAAAARALGVDESTIRRSIKFGRKVMGKFKFHNSKEVSGKIMKVLNSPAKILIVDIETSPIRSYTWGLWKQNIYLDQIISNWFMLTWAAKWLGEEEVLSDKLNGKEVIEEDDERIIISLWKLLDQADIVVAHNGCVEKNTPILMKDFTWKPAGELKEGDEIIAFEEGLSPETPLRNSSGNWSNTLGRSRKLKLATVTHNNVVKAKTVKVKFTNGYELITTPNHPWLMKTKKDNFLKWRNSEDLKAGDRIIRMCQPWNNNMSYEGGWMSGFIEGEGSLIKTNNIPSSIQWCQRPTIVKETSDTYADILGINRFDYLPKTNWGLGKGDCIYTNTIGGKYEVFKLLGSLNLNRLKTHIDYESLGSLYGQDLESTEQETYYVESVEECEDTEIAQLSTSTKTYIADGFAMHNSSFDIPKMNSRFIVHGLNPPSPYKQIDTKIIAKNQFGFSSNKLQALAEMFGYEGKFDTDFELWSKCMQGDEESLKYMETYNKQDVLVLENVYLKLRPYAKGHPNVNMYVDEEEASCPHCGGKHLQLIEGKYFYTQAVRYSTFRCMNCGAISRSKSAVKYNFKKKISAIPK